MTQSNRIHGGQIDRSKTIRFTFDGLPYEGHTGDTLASALLANGCCAPPSRSASLRFRSVPQLVECQSHSPPLVLLARSGY